MPRAFLNILLPWELQNKDVEVPQVYYLAIQKISYMYPTRHSSTFTFYPANPAGNEPDIEFDVKNKIKENFVYIGTGALVKLKHIHKLIDGSLEQKLVLPKVYILDNSCKVQLFWEHIKRIVEASSSWDEFQIQTLLNHKNFSEVCFPEIKNISNSIINAMELFIKDPNENYLYFRKVIENLTFIRHDWDNPSVFEILKSRTPDTPFVVYASNIIEYVAMNYDEYAWVKMHSIINNIQSLNPRLVIHTRTSMAEISNHANLKGWSIKPDCSIILDKEQAAGLKHLDALQDPRYVSLYFAPKPLEVIYHRAKSNCLMQ